LSVVALAAASTGSGPAGRAVRDAVAVSLAIWGDCQFTTSNRRPAINGRSVCTEPATKSKLLL
jgi:hypothetical protein